MAITILPWQGIGFPAFIIATLGYGGHYFIFSEDLSWKKQLWFQFSLSMLWISYIIAIFKSPGSPPKSFEPKAGEWRRWCKKCEAYKPERTHHCKTCKACVLKMDHHCPWTANCVGHKNMPHFLRFLLWVNYTNGLCFYYLCKRLNSYWDDRDLPIYLISKTSLTVSIILALLSFLVIITVGILTLRCLYHILFTSMTQIEAWEFERIEAQLENGKLYPKLKRNFQLLFDRPMAQVTSWSTSHNVLKDSMDESDMANFGIDDIVFPYDVNPWNNLITSLGYPWCWILPWGGANGNGLEFDKTNLIDTEDDLSSLPWPPDGGHQDKDGANEFIDDKERVVRRRATIADTTQWSNVFGETISDYGVDDT